MSTGKAKKTSEAAWQACAAAIGRRVRHLRALAGLSQVELGNLLGGFSIDVIGRLERGDALTVSADLAAALAQWCELQGYSTAWLFGGAAPMELSRPRPGVNVETILAALAALRDPQEHEARREVDVDQPYFLPRPVGRSFARPEDINRALREEVRRTRAETEKRP